MAQNDRQGPAHRSGSVADMLRLTGVGLELAAAIGGMTYAGYLADRQWGWSPWGTLTGALLGMVGGCYSAIRSAQRLTRRK